MDAATPKFIAAQAATAALVKAGATRLDGYALYNSGAAVAYLQCFDAVQVADVTVGTTTPKLSIPVPAAGQVSLAGLKAAFQLGLVVAATAGPANNTAPGAAMVVNLAVR